MQKKLFIGVDVGSVTVKCALMNEDMELIAHRYIPTSGKPIVQIQKLMREMSDEVPPGYEIGGAGTTGSARYLAGEIIGADVIKNEITAHAIAATHFYPDVKTILEIGGQDSKIIIIRDSVVTDFGMNTVCAAGTGSFLDHQALRLGIKIEEFAAEAMKSKNPVRIAGRCTVFAESDMIHKQQMGHSSSDILYGLCQALVRNYINNVGLGKTIEEPIIFQGGVAFNQAIVRAFEEELGTKIMVPKHHEVMGAIGAAIIAWENYKATAQKSKFKGFSIGDIVYETTTFICSGCPNQCEIAQLKLDGKVLARWGGRCEKWEYAPAADDIAEELEDLAITN
ncbi:MAG: acyl-CoA dehydratase activase [Dehalococcoidales bacterium]